MDVDPAVLRRFSDSTAQRAEMLAELDLAGPFAPTRGAAPGTEITGVGREALEATMTAVRHVCLRLTCVSQLAKGTAHNYQVTDTDFAEMLKAMGAGR